jgi:flagellar motor switch protein FliG
MGEAALAVPAIPAPKKAAILMVLLGEETAGKLLQHLPRGQMTRIAREVATLGPIEPAVADQVLREYFSDAVKPPEERGGVDVARRILARAAITEEQAEKVLGRDPGPAAKLVAPLLQTPVPTLARALGAEHPQTIALVLVNMPSSRAGRVLKQLPDAVRAETVLRMAGLRQVRGELLHEVASTLQEGLKSAPADDDSSAALDAIERTAAILASMSRSDARHLLEEIKRDQPEQGVELQSRIFTFESLVHADDRGIQELLREIEAKRIAMALKDAPEEIARKFFANLSERAATMLKDEMEFLGAMRSDEQVAARREVVDTALRLEEEGRLAFAEAENAEDDEDA